MTRARLLIVGAAAIGVVLTLSPGAAQQPAAPTPPADQAQLPTFRTGANLVRVDVTVLDHRGSPVPSLTPEDFLIEEDGVPQKVTSLKFVEATGQPTDDLSLPIRSPEHAAAEAARDDVRVFLIFWDEYSIEQFASSVRAREALARLVTSFQPTDLVALMDQLTPADAIRFTRNFNDLGLDVRKLQGRLGLFFPTRSAVEDAQLAKGGDIRRLRAEVTLSALKAAVVHLGTLREGRKSVIFVSEGVRGLGNDATTIMSDVVRAANESNTAIYSVDPRGLTAGRASTDSLYMLADNTGGRTIVNTNGLDVALRQVVREASAFYLLGYSSIRNPADGRFHQIKVRVDRPGLDVRARRGYWAPSLKAVEDAKVAAATATPPDAVAVALAALTPPTSRHVLDLWTGISRTAGGQPALRVAWARRGARSTTPGTPVTVGISATSGAEVRDFAGPVAGAGPTFELPAGAVKVQLTVRDAESRVIDTETRALTIPAVTPSTMVWTSPVLLRGRTPLELRAIAADPDPQPYAGSELSRNDRLLVRLSLLGEGADATVASHLVSRTGRPLVALPIAPLAGQAGTYQIDLPLTSVAPGDYVINIEAARGDQRVEAFVAIRVQG